MLDWLQEADLPELVEALNSVNREEKYLFMDNEVTDMKEKEKIFREGYGLYLIRKMCEVYGWAIKETGIPEEGVQFTIDIPWRGKALD